MKLFIKNTRQARGKHAENTALSYLKRQGLKLLQKNYHSRFGEIDLIMREGNTWVFIEVRSRAESAQVSAIESITPQKMHKIRKTAEYYLIQFDELPDCRFDVIAMTHNRNRLDYTIDWIKNAF